MRERSTYTKWSIKLTKTKWIYLTRQLRCLSQQDWWFPAGRQGVERRAVDFSACTLQEWPDLHRYGCMGTFPTPTAEEDQDERSEAQLRRRYSPHWALRALWLRIVAGLLQGVQNWRNHVRADHATEAGPVWEDDQTLHWERWKVLLAHHLPGRCTSPSRTCWKTSKDGSRSAWPSTASGIQSPFRSCQALGVGLGWAVHGSPWILASWSHRALHALPGEDDQPECPGWGWLPNQAQGNHHYVHKIDACTDFATITTFEAHQASQRPRHQGASCWRRWELHPQWALSPISDRRAHWEIQQRQIAPETAVADISAQSAWPKNTVPTNANQMDQSSLEPTTVARAAVRAPSDWSLCNQRMRIQRCRWRRIPWEKVWKPTSLIAQSLRSLAHTRPEPANAARCILHLFSGPHHRPDGLAAKLKSLGWDCKEYDLVNREQEDLTNDFIWQQVKADIRAKKYDGLIAGPPCNTFTNVRKDDGLGPLPLRGPSGPDRYGLAHLAGEEKDKVRIGTLNFAGTEIGRSCTTLRRPGETVHHGAT